MKPDVNSRARNFTALCALALLVGTAACSGSALPLPSTTPTEEITFPTPGASASAASQAPRLERVSLSASGTQGNGPSDQARISANGRYVVFRSGASNLVAGDTNRVADIFVRDLVEHTTTRVSVSSSGAQANDASAHPSISADGQTIAFDSKATNLATGETNDAPDVFVHRMSGETIAASVSNKGVRGDAASFGAEITSEGTRVLFVSAATNLGHGDKNNATDVFLRDLVTNKTRIVSVASDGTVGNAASGVGDVISPSAYGVYFAFASDASNLAAGDRNGATDVFVHELKGRVTTRISDGGTAPFVSSDGRYVAFESRGGLFVRDLTRPGLTRVKIAVGAPAASILIAGVYEIVDPSHAIVVAVPGLPRDTATQVARSMRAPPASISSDGRTFAYASAARDLTRGDTNGVADVFVYRVG